MTENEKALRAMLLKRMPGTSEDVFDALDALLAESRTSARDAALEEAEFQIGEAWRELAEGLDISSAYAAGAVEMRGDAVRRIRALKSQPARCYLDAEEVEKVLADLRAYGHAREVEAISTQQSHVGGRSVAWTVEQAAERLGLGLDAV